MTINSSAVCINAGCLKAAVALHAPLIADLVGDLAASGETLRWSTSTRRRLGPCAPILWPYRRSDAGDGSLRFNEREVRWLHRVGRGMLRGPGPGA